MTAFLVLALASGVVASAAEAVADDRSAIITLLQASLGASEAAVKQMKEPGVSEAKRLSLRHALDKLNRKADTAANALPEDPEVQAIAFQQALAAEDWERCRRYGGASLSKAETARDSNAQAAAWVMLGQTAAFEGDYERAVREAEKALSLHPEDKDATLLHQYAKGRRKAVPAGTSAAQVQASNAADVAANAAAQASISAGKSLLKGLAPPPDPEAGHEDSARRAVRLAGMFALTLSGGLLLTMGAWGRVFEEKFPGARLRMGWAAALCGALAAGGAYFARPIPSHSESLGALAPGDKTRMLDVRKFVSRAGHSQANNVGKSPTLPDRMSNQDFAKVMRWGTGDEAARARIATLTRGELGEAQITRAMAKEWRDFYIQEKIRIPQNPSAQGRAELMQRAVELLGE